MKIQFSYLKCKLHCRPLLRMVISSSEKVILVLLITLGQNSGVVVAVLAVYCSRFICSGVFVKFLYLFFISVSKVVWIELEITCQALPPFVGQFQMCLVQCFVKVGFFMYRNLISFLIPNLRIFMAAGEICGIFIFEYLEVKLYYRHCLLK